MAESESQPFKINQLDLRQHPISELFNQDKIRDGTSNKLLIEYGGTQGLLTKLKTSTNSGISSDPAEIQKRTMAYGTNVKTYQPPSTFFELFFGQFEDFIIQLLLGASIISLIVGLINDPEQGWLESTSIFAALLIVTIVTSVNDYQKEQQYVKLNQDTDVVSIQAIRDSKEVEIFSHEILVGDVVRVEPGSIILADGVVIKGNGLFLDESAMTGESKQVQKVSIEEEPKGNPFLISGSVVTDGNGLMLVCAVGELSQNGKSQEVLQLKADPTPLQDKLEHFAMLIGKVGFIVAIALSTILITYTIMDAIVEDSWSHNDTSQVINALILGITIVVVAIPEGLPLAVTLSLAYSVFKMKEDNNFVRHLRACETMGAATVILTDKTGTLTQNKMTVTKGLYLGKQISFFQKDSQISEKAMSFLAENIARNSTASLEMTEKTTKHIGNKTECALLHMIQILGQDYRKFRDPSLEALQIPFSSTRKRMSTIYANDKNYDLYVKGAAEVILSQCTNIMTTDLTTEPISPELLLNLKQTIQEYSDDFSLRVVALAYQQLDSPNPSEKELQENLTLLGIFGIEDPVRDEVQEVMPAIQYSGIKVIMVTGDSLQTAVTIAKRTNILPQASYDYTAYGQVIEGGKLSAAVGGLVPQYNEEGIVVDYKVQDLEMFEKVSADLRVVARCSPQDKLLLTVGFKALGEVVSVTGDGSNDAQAMKKADVGLAMMSGTALCKDSSDIILLDDSFKSIVSSIKWGRNVYAGIRKFLQFQVTINIVALGIALIGSICHQKSPLTAVEMLWVNLIMDSLAALALSTESPSNKLLLQKPHKRDEFILTHYMITFIAVMSVYQLAVCLFILFFGYKWFDIEAGWKDEEEGDTRSEHYTFLFHTFVVMQLFNQVNCRKLSYRELNVFQNFFGNWIFIAISIFIVLGQYSFVEFGGAPLHAAPLEINQHLISLAFGLGTWVVCFGLKVVILFVLKIGKKSEDVESEPLLRNGLRKQQQTQY